MRVLELLKQFQYSDDIAGGYLRESISESIKELEEYQSDMDSYLDYTTGSRCTKSFNSCLGSIKIAYENELEKIVKENIEDELVVLQNENKSLTKTLEKHNEEMIKLRIEKKELIQVLIDAQETINKILEK